MPINVVLIKTNWLFNYLFDCFSSKVGHNTQQNLVGASSVSYLKQLIIPQHKKEYYLWYIVQT